MLSLLGVGEGVVIVEVVRFEKGFIVVEGFLVVFLLWGRLFDELIIIGLIFSRFVSEVVVVDVGGDGLLFKDRRFNNIFVFFV